MKKLVAVAAFAVVMLASQPIESARRCTLVKMINVSSTACCPGGSHYICCCEDCSGRYEYHDCGNGVLKITAFCCSL